MKKTMSVIMSVIFIVSLFSGCGKLFKPSVKSIVKDMQYYNQKAIDNLDSLIGLNPDEVENWINETFNEDEIKKANIDNEEASPAYLSKNETVKIFFIIDGESNRFFIVPNYDNHIDGSDQEFADSKYLERVNAYCADEDADYKQPPTICELALYDFDKADESTRLVYYYLFSEYGGWSWNGDEGPYNSMSFIYENGTFKTE